MCKLFAATLHLSPSVSATTPSLRLNGHFSRWTWVSWHRFKQRMMEVVVTTGPVSRAKLQSNHHPQQTNIQFFTGLMPFLSPNQQCQSTEGKISHSMDLLTPSSPGVFHLCLWPPIAPGNLGGWLPCLWSALWCQCPPWRKICNRAFRSEFFWNSLNTSLCHCHVLFSIITDNSVKSFHCISSLCPPICFE